MQQLPVSQLMRVCPTAVVQDSTRLREAAEILIVNDYATLIVADDAGKFLGVVPESAVIRHLMSVSNTQETILPIISRHVESVRSDADITSVLHLFRSSCHGVVPVVSEDDKVVGILHRRDIVSHLLSDVGRAENSSGDESTGQDSVTKPHFMNRPADRVEKQERPPSNSAE
ncbi:MAG: CBS domain-containing protein [Fuerstiella sp.]